MNIFLIYDGTFEGSQFCSLSFMFGCHMAFNGLVSQQINVLGVSVSDSLMNGPPALFSLLSKMPLLLDPKHFLSPCGVCRLELIFIGCINIETKRAITLSFGPG